MKRSSRRSDTSHAGLPARLAAQFEARLEELEAAIAERDTLVADLKDQLQQRDVTVAALQERVRHLQGQLRAEGGEGERQTGFTRRTPVPLPRRAGRRRMVWLPPLLLGICILLLILHETGVLLPVESALQVVTAPLRRQTAALVEGAGDLFRTVREARQWQARADELQESVDALSVENVRLREIEAEAVTLRALLDFSVESPTWGLVGADVVGRSACANAPCGEAFGQEPNPYLRYLTINVGSGEMVGVGMPVVTGGAVLVGRVAEVGPYTSKVELLNDPGSGVAVLLQESRATGLVAGQPDGSLRMIYIPQEDEVQVGDIVLTSGLAGVLPRGLVVGQVAEVQQQDFALFQEAVVRPAVDYREVEMMLVIVSFEPLVQEEAESGELP